MEVKQLLIPIIIALLTGWLGLMQKGMWQEDTDRKALANIVYLIKEKQDERTEKLKQIDKSERDILTLQAEMKVLHTVEAILKQVQEDIREIKATSQRLLEQRRGYLPPPGELYPQSVEI